MTTTIASPPPPPDRAAAPAPARLPYVDALRVLALAGVVVVHVAQVFNPADEWHIQNPERAPWAGALAALMAPWIMPLFFVVAGIATWHSLARRSNREFLAERARRLLLPLVVGTLLFVPPQVYLERRLHGEFGGSFLRFLPHFFDGIYPKGNLSWHQLWFLAHLFAYSVALLPLFRYWQSPRGSSAMRRLAGFARTRTGLLALALPLILERQLLWGLFPERHMLAADWSNHALLLVAFAYGFAVAGAPALAASIDRYWRGLAAVGAAISSLLIAAVWVGAVPFHLPPPYAPRYLGFWTLYAIDAWAWIVALLGAGRRWLRTESAAVRAGRRYGLAWYVLHQPILLALAYGIVQWRLDVFPKFVLLLTGTVVLTWVAGLAGERVPGLRLVLGFDAQRGHQERRV
ncbi:MAG: acyltransferase [Gemmatimonadota bacterium]|nr:acyltransferase [Gemmatimonadota bacterium]MDE3217554.1 acyltransferase [Gemmatimonadota bacterium]